MALLLTTKSSTGYVVRDAYVKIDEYSCKGNFVDFRLRAYVSKELSETGASYIEGSEEMISFRADYSDDSFNTKKQIYEYVKTLEKYQNAMDF